MAERGVYQALRVGGEPTALQAQPSIEVRYTEYQQLVVRAVEVFGSEIEANRWLSSSSADFGNRTPLQTLVERGPDLPMSILGRIEHGVYF